MFAATGTLHPETEGDTFGDHRFGSVPTTLIWGLDTEL